MIGETSGATGREGGRMKYGDRIYDTLLKRYAIAGEFLPDGDVDVRWENDGSYGQSKWHRCIPAPRDKAAGPKNTLTVRRMTNRSPHFQPGWWILPSVLGGALIWTATLYGCVR